MVGDLASIASQCLEAHQIGLRQGLNGARDVDGRFVDRDDASAAPLGEMFHSNNYAPDLARRGQGERIFFVSASASIERIFIIEITGEDDRWGTREWRSALGMRRI